MPPELTFRARVVAITPSEPIDINWRWGGEGLGGTPKQGVFGNRLEVGQWSQPVPVASLVPDGSFPAPALPDGDGRAPAASSPRPGGRRATNGR